MNNFDFEDFLNFFGDGSDLFDELHQSHKRHGVNFMYIRKKADGVAYSPKEDEEISLEVEHFKYKDGLPYEIYGPGKGMKLPKVYTKDSEWEEESAAEDHEEYESLSETEEEQDHFMDFIEENVTIRSDKAKCNLCKESKRMSDTAIKKHFRNTHKEEYDKSKHAQMCEWSEAIKRNKELERKMEKEFEKMMDFGMGIDMEDFMDFDDSKRNNKRKKKKDPIEEMEKLFFESMLNQGKKKK